MSFEDQLLLPPLIGRLKAWPSSSLPSSSASSSADYRNTSLSQYQYDTRELLSINHSPSISEKQCRRLMRICLPISLRHCHSSEQQSLLYLLMSNLVHYNTIKDEVLPQLLSFLEKLDVHDSLWLTCCESGFGYNFLNAIFQVLVINGGHDVVVGFIMEKVQSLVQSLQHTFIENSGGEDEEIYGREEAGNLNPMSTLDKSRAILLQELLHAIYSGSSSSLSSKVTNTRRNDWGPHFQELSNVIRTITSICAPFSTPLLISLTSKALLVGQYILKDVRVLFAQARDAGGEMFDGQQQILEQLLEAVAFVHSSVVTAENLQLFKIGLMILLELNKYTTDTSLIEYTAQTFVRYIEFYPSRGEISLTSTWKNVEDVLNVIIEIFSLIEHSDGLLIVAAAVAKFIVRVTAMIPYDNLFADDGPHTRVLELCAILFDKEYQSTLSSTSASCNMMSWLFDMIHAALLTKAEISASIGFCIDLLSIFTKKFQNKAMIFGTYKELLRLSQLPIYHNPVILKKLINHILDIGHLIQDEKCISVVIFHILHLMEENVTSIIQLIVQVVFLSDGQKHSMEVMSRDTTMEFLHTAEEISKRMNCMSQCFALCCSHISSASPGMKRYDEWFRRLVDMLIRFVNTAYIKEDYDVLLKRCPSILDPVIICVTSLLESICLFRQASLSNEILALNTLKAKLIDENIMTIRLWLSLFLIFVRCTSNPTSTSAFDSRLNNPKQHLDVLYCKFVQLAHISPPVVFGSLLCTFGDSKKQYDIVDEILISDSAISFLVNCLFVDEDIDWMIKHYLGEDAGISVSSSGSSHKQNKQQRTQLMHQGQLSKQQYIFHICVLHFLEMNRIKSCADCRFLLCYLQDISICTKASNHKKKLMIAIIRDVMDQWLNTAFNHFVTLENPPPASLPGQKFLQFSEEEEYCKLIQTQLLFLFERSIDRRHEVRNIVSSYLIEALGKLHFLSKIDAVLSVRSNQGLLGLIETIDFLQEISCNIAHDSVASLTIPSKDNMPTVDRNTQFQSILSFPEVAYPSNQKEFCIGCEELLYVAYLWLSYMDLSAAAPSLSTVLQEHSSTSLVKAVIEEMIGNDTPVYHLQKQQEDNMHGRVANADTIKLLRSKAAKRAAEYKMKAFLSSKKKKKLSLLTLGGLSINAAAKKYYKQHHLQHQQQVNNLGDNGKSLGAKPEGDIGGAEKLIHLLTSKYGEVERAANVENSHPLSILLRKLGKQLYHHSHNSHRISSLDGSSDLDILEYIPDILGSLSHVKHPIELKKDILYALQITECILFTGCLHGDQNPMEVLQLWKHCLHTFEHHWGMISSFVLNALTTFLLSKLDHLHGIMAGDNNIITHENSSMTYLLLGYAVDMLKGIIYDKRFAGSSSCSHDYHLIRCSMASFLSFWSNRESAMSSFTASSPLASMGYSCKVALCHVAFEVLKQSHGSHNEMPIACNRIYREQLILSICFLLQSINEESQKTANAFLFRFSATQENSSDVQKKWKEQAESATKECLQWIQILVALIEDSKKWSIEYNFNSIEQQQRNAKTSSSRVSMSTTSCQQSIDGHPQHQPVLDLCLDIYGITEAHQKPPLLFGFPAFKNQVLIKMGLSTSKPFSSGYSSPSISKSSIAAKHHKGENNSKLYHDPIDEEFFQSLLNQDVFVDALRRQRTFGMGNLTWNAVGNNDNGRSSIKGAPQLPGLVNSGIFMLIYVLIHHRLDQLISRHALSIINNSPPAESLQNHHTEHLERIRNALEALSKLEHKHGLPSSSSFYGQKDVKLYKRSIKTAWSLSPKLALMLKECFFELIGERDGRRKGIHTLALFLNLNCIPSRECDFSSLDRYSAMSVSSWFAGYKDWRMLYPLLDLALSHSSAKQFDDSEQRMDRSSALKVLDTLPPAPLYVLLNLLSRCTLYLAGQDVTMSLSSLVSSKNLIPTVVRYVVRSLHHVARDDILFYLPQLVQLLRVDEFGFIHDYLRYQAESSPLICHQLLWNLQTESNKSNIVISNNATTAAKFGYCKTLTGIDPLVSKSESLLSEISSPLISSLSPLHLKYMVEEISFFNALTNISETLKAIKNKELHPKAVKDIVAKMKIPRGLYLPTNPMKKVIAIDIDSASPMQSAAKCPYLLKFVTQSWNGPDAYIADGIKQQHKLQQQMNQREAGRDELLLPIGAYYPSPKKKMMVANPMSPFRTTSQRQFEVESAEKEKGSVTDNKSRSSLSKRKNKNVEFGKDVKSTPSLDALKFEELLEKEKVDNEKVSTESKVSSSHIPLNIAQTPKDIALEPTVRVPLRSRKLYRNPRLAQSKHPNKEQFVSPQASASINEDDFNGKGIGRRETGFTSPKASFRSPSSHSILNSTAPLNSSFTTPKKAIHTSFGGLRSPTSATNSVVVRSHLKDFGPLLLSPPTTTNSRRERKPLKVATNSHTDACIFKVFDDCRQDVITLQVIRLLRNWFQLRSIPVYLMPYSIVSNRTGPSNALGGILEVIPKVMSRDQIGKAGVGKSLKQYYLTKFGPEGSDGFHAAQLAFASSLAAYSVVCYLLHIKDRHNGNILIDDEGHLIHIDYGFILGISPGKNLGFEVAPFKLSKEMMDLMGGTSSEIYHKYCNLTVQCFLSAREIMLAIVSTVVAYADSDLPCFQHKESVLRNLKNRFVPEMTDIDAANHMKKLIEKAREHWTTGAYDGVQKLQNNIFSEEWR